MIIITIFSKQFCPTRCSHGTAERRHEEWYVRSRSAQGPTVPRWSGAREIACRDKEHSSSKEGRQV